MLNHNQLVSMSNPRSVGYLIAAPDDPHVSSGIGRPRWGRHEPYSFEGIMRPAFKSSYRGPRYDRMLAIWPVRLVVLINVCVYAQLPVWLVSSSSKLEAYTVPRNRLLLGR